MQKYLIYDNKEYSDFLIDENGNIYNVKTGHTYKKSIGQSGYYIITLAMGKRGKVKSIRLHKALAETFIPNPHNYPIVLHKDENKLNCKLDNLEWGSYEKNTNDHWKSEICNKRNPYVNNRKLTKADVDVIRKLKSEYSYLELADIYKVSKTTIANVVKNKSYNKDY